MISKLRKGEKVKGSFSAMLPCHRVAGGDGVRWLGRFGLCGAGGVGGLPRLTCRGGVCGVSEIDILWDDKSLHETKKTIRLKFTRQFLT